MAKSANNKPTASKSTAKASKSTAVSVHVSSDLVDPSVGRLVVSLLRGSEQDEAKRRELGQKAEAGRNEAIAHMTLKFYEALELDPECMNVSHVYSDEKAKKTALLDAADVLLGIKEISDGAIQYTEEFRKTFPPAKPTKAYKETQKYKDARSFQANFQTKKSKAVEYVLGFHETGTTPSWDETARTLRVTNAPKQIAGPSGEVVLSGAQVEGAQEKASLEAFRRIAQASVGKAPAAGKKTNGESLAQRALESEDAFGELVNSLIRAIRGKEGTFSANDHKHLDSLALVLVDAGVIKA